MIKEIDYLFWSKNNSNNFRLILNMHSDLVMKSLQRINQEFSAPKRPFNREGSEKIKWEVQCYPLFQPSQIYCGNCLC